MNPFFILLVILGVVILWFLLSFLFKPLGKIVSKVLQDTFNIMNEEESEEKEK